MFLLLLRPPRALLGRPVLSIFVFLSAPSLGARLSTIPQSIHCKVEHQAICKQGLVFELRVSRPRCPPLPRLLPSLRNDLIAGALSSYNGHPYLTGNSNFDAAPVATASLDLPRESWDLFSFAEGSYIKGIDQIFSRNKYFSIDWHVYDTG